jgi:hypothetical protein
MAATAFDAQGWILRDDVRSVPPNTRARIVRYLDGAVAVYDGDRTLTGFPAGEIVRVDVHDQTTWERRRPTWAVVLGIIGLLFFLLGALLFLVKTNVPVQSAVVTLQASDGGVIAFAVPQPAAAVRARFM